MPVDTFTCPECQVKLRRSPHLQAGAQVQCPRCRTQFPVPPPEEGAAATPGPRPSSTDAYGDAPSGPRRDIDRERDDLVGTAPRRSADLDRDDYGPARRRGYEEVDEDYPRVDGPRGEPGELSSNYKIDIGQWFSIGYQHWGSVLGASIGFSILLFFVVVLCAIPFVGLLVSLFLLPPLAAGYAIVALAQLKGKRWAFGDFFSGFNWYGSILGVTVLVALIMLACYLPYLIAYIAFLVVPLQGGGPPGPEALLILPALLLTICGVCFFQIRYMWAIFLVVDRNFGPIQALRGSWKLTQGQFWMTFVVWLLLQLINSAGLMACLVGMLFTVPLTMLVLGAGYLLIAGTQPPVSLDRSPAPAAPPRADREDVY
jgi:hypothetical protein